MLILCHPGFNRLWSLCLSPLLDFLQMGMFLTWFEQYASSWLRAPWSARTKTSTKMTEPTSATRNQLTKKTRAHSAWCLACRVVSVFNRSCCGHVVRLLCVILMCVMLACLSCHHLLSLSSSLASLSFIRY